MKGSTGSRVFKSSFSEFSTDRGHLTDLSPKLSLFPWMSDTAMSRSFDIAQCKDPWSL